MREPADDSVQIPAGLLGSRRPLGKAVHVGWRGRNRARNAEEPLGDDALWMLAATISSSARFANGAQAMATPEPRDVGAAARKERGGDGSNQTLA